MQPLCCSSPLVWCACHLAIPMRRPVLRCPGACAAALLTFVRDRDQTKRRGLYAYTRFFLAVTNSHPLSKGTTRARKAPAHAHRKSNNGTPKREVLSCYHCTSAHRCHLDLAHRAALASEVESVHARLHVDVLGRTYIYAIDAHAITVHAITVCTITM